MSSVIYLINQNVSWLAVPNIIEFDTESNWIFFFFGESLITNIHVFKAVICVIRWTDSTVVYIIMFRLAYNHDVDILCCWRMQHRRLINDAIQSLFDWIVVCSDRGLPLHIYASRRCVIQCNVAEVADVTDRQTPSFDTAGSAVTLGALERLQLIQLHVTPTNVLDTDIVVKPSNGLEIHPRK